MRDNFGDRVVASVDGPNCISLVAEEDDLGSFVSKSATMVFTPSKARKLARQLKRAARTAEGK